MTLRLGSLTRPIEFPISGKRPLQLREANEEDSWIELPAPVVPGRYLVILRREQPDTTWEDVVMRLVKDDLPAGGLRFVNASARTLALVFGSRRIALVSGKDWTTYLGPGKVVGFQLGIPDPESGGRLRRTLSRSLEQGQSERTLVILSESDRSDARQELKITTLRERVKKRLPPEEGRD